MTPEEWYALRDDRQLRYAGRVLPHDRPILIELEPDYGARYDGQIAAIVATNLLSRMSPRVALSFPPVPIVAPLPWAGADLGNFALETACAADPFGSYELRAARNGDYVLHLGRGPSADAVHGSGWGAFVGPGQSPISNSNASNPIGPALAVITACARLFGHELAPLDGPFVLDAFTWTEAPPARDAPFPTNIDLGQVWTIGTGSVGSAALYFLTLVTRSFSSVAFDMDEVKVVNLDRSPIFTAHDAEKKVSKANAATAYLRNVGVVDAQCEGDALDQSRRWRDRPQNVPDIVIATANERNVRYVIEQSYPPLQFYATTGRNWNVTLFRHIPLVDPCSCCAFPPKATTGQITCAEGAVHDPQTGQDVDAALPFLSFAAGLLTAAEIFKVKLPIYPNLSDRVFFSLGPEVSPNFVRVPAQQRPGCLCITRSANVHKLMVEKTRYAGLSRL